MHFNSTTDTLGVPSNKSSGTHATAFGRRFNESHEGQPQTIDLNNRGGGAIDAVTDDHDGEESHHENVGEDEHSDRSGTRTGDIAPAVPSVADATVETRTEPDLSGESGEHHGHDSAPGSSGMCFRSFEHDTRSIGGWTIDNRGI